MSKPLSMSTVKPLSVAVTDVLTVFGGATEVVLCGRILYIPVGTLLGLALSGAVLPVGGSIVTPMTVTNDYCNI